MSETLKVFLREVALFSELSDEELAILAQVATETAYPRNSPIVREGDPGGSLLIVESGEVKVVLERSSGEAVHLSTFRRGEFFGEMSLFDAKPRSATAVAVVDSRVVEIGAQAFRDEMTRNPQIALKILGEIAGRGRRTDETVREMADKVYREASSALQASVAAQLDSIKTIYQTTEQRATETLERANQTVGHVEKLWSLIIRAVPVAGIALGVLVFMGVKSWHDLSGRFAQFEEWHTKAGSAVKEIEEKRKDINQISATLGEARNNLKVMEETTLVLRSVREATDAFQRRVATSEDLRWAAQNYEGEKRRLLERYIVHPTTGVRYGDYPPEVVLEAVDLFVALASGARRDGALTPQDRTEHLLGALLFVLNNPADTADPSGRGRSTWREERKMRELFGTVGAGADARQRKATLDELKKTLREARPERTRENAALILADFDERDEGAIAALKKAIEEPRKSAHRKAASAIALARLKDPGGWKYLTQQLEAREDDRAYPAAAQLAQLERGGLEQLGTRAGQSKPDVDRLTVRIKTVISARAPRNCFEERYARHLVACLDGDCRTASAGGLVGGECTVVR